jgi:hypothetical protein
MSAVLSMTAPSTGPRSDRSPTDARVTVVTPGPTGADAGTFPADSSDAIAPGVRSAVTGCRDVGPGHSGWKALSPPGGSRVGWIDEH